MCSGLCKHKKCPHKMAGQLGSYMVKEPMSMANIHIVCSGDCCWLLVCSGVLVCTGISMNRCKMVP